MTTGETPDRDNPRIAGLSPMHRMRLLIADAMRNMMHVATAFFVAA